MEGKEGEGFERMKDYCSYNKKEGERFGGEKFGGKTWTDFVKNTISSKMERFLHYVWNWIATLERKETKGRERKGRKMKGTGREEKWKGRNSCLFWMERKGKEGRQEFSF